MINKPMLTTANGRVRSIGTDVFMKDVLVAVYGGALVKGAPHPQAGHEWLEFLRSPDGLAIFESFGFKPAPGAEYP